MIGVLAYHTLAKRGWTIRLFVTGCMTERADGFLRARAGSVTSTPAVGTCGGLWVDASLNKDFFQASEGLKLFQPVKVRRRDLESNRRETHSCFLVRAADDITRWSNYFDPVLDVLS